MNQFMTRLIFGFFAEDTDIFAGDNLFTSTIEQMSDSHSDNTRQVIAELFRAMDTPREERAAANLPNRSFGGVVGRQGTVFMAQECPAQTFIFQ